MELHWNPPQISDRTATYTWGGGKVDYAKKVHDGEVDAEGNQTPERPWTTVTIEATDLPTLFADRCDISSNVAEGIDRAFDEMAIDLGERFGETIDSYQWDIEPGGRKRHKNAPTFVTISDSEALKNSLDIQLD